MTTLAFRTRAQIEHDCRVNRLVDWLVSRMLSGVTIRHPATWRDWEWAFAGREAGQRAGDETPDDAIRASVIREYDAISTNLERRRAG